MYRRDFFKLLSVTPLAPYMLKKKKELPMYGKSVLQMVAEMREEESFVSSDKYPSDREIIPGEIGTMYDVRWVMHGDKLRCIKEI